MTIAGTCDTRFLRVKDQFAENFAARGELGAAVAIEIDGRRVVDLWAGWTDKTRARPFSPDALVNVYSATKAIAAITALHLVDTGRLELHAPVARLWPQFAASGKEQISLADLLSHRAGLPAVRAQLPPEALYDWERMTEALAAEIPWWPPGTAHGYHAMTFGWLVGEVVRRATGKSLGALWRDELARPCSIDFQFGVALDDEPRVVELRNAAPPQPGERNLFAEMREAPESMSAKAFANPTIVLDAAVANSPAWRRVELPALNGHTNARALARLYGALARDGALDGRRILSPTCLLLATAERSHGPDLVLGENTRFGFGFMLPHAGLELGPNPHVFGHPGAGGALGFADRDAAIGFGYTPNKLGNKLLIDPRATALIDALYQSLA
jgi:CubicO group peptidase (beta-lactamase class C family)